MSHGLRAPATRRRGKKAQRIGAALVLVLGVLVLAFVAVGTGRAVGAVLAALTAGLALLLAARLRGTESAAVALERTGDWTSALAPGVLLVYFSFNGGGYFPGSQAFIALILALVLALRVMFASDPLAGFGPVAGIASGCLALYCVWTAASCSWSHAPGRAIEETNRALLYLLVLVLFASMAKTTWRMRWMVRGLAAGATAVCAVGLITRLLPDLWPITPDIQQGRLSYPVTYWNALGMVAALGILFCAHLTSSEREPPASRVLGAAAIPLLASTLLFTFSRGAIAVTILGLLAYALLARPRKLITGAAAAGSAAAVAVVTSYGADLLASDNPTSPAATAQGHHVALVVAVCVAGGALTRLALLPVDTVLERARLPARTRRPVIAAAWGVAAVVAIAVFVGVHGPQKVSHNYDRFVHGNDVVMSGDLRARLSDPGNNRRIDQWKVAIDGFQADKFKGLGAGTYQNLWNERRPVEFSIRDAHSLYAEVLDELGITGLLLLAAALIALLASFLRGWWRERDRYVYAALTAAALAWLVRAGLDWDWEMPAITLWLFAAGGAAAAVSRESRRRPLKLAAALRLPVSLICVAVAVLPGVLAVSQSRLDRASAAFANDDCANASTQARDSLDVIGFRPEPHEILAYCLARAGRYGPARKEAREAVRRDPGNWQYSYALALVLAAAGDDGSRAAGAAQRLNPRDPIATGLASRLRPGQGRSSRAVARELITVGP